MNDIVINTDNLTIDVEPKVISSGAITFIRNGQELGSIDAEFDLTSIQNDPELVHLALQLIHSFRQRVHIAL